MGDRMNVRFVQGNGRSTQKIFSDLEVFFRSVKVCDFQKAVESIILFTMKVLHICPFCTLNVLKKIAVGMLEAAYLDKKNAIKSVTTHS